MTAESPQSVPRHVAIIMDGNGRWAKQQGKPRQFGHQAGSEAARKIIEESARRGIEVLTLFAFSSENWRRPSEETSFLMDLFFRALEREVRVMEKMNIRLRIVGEREMLPARLVKRIEEAEIKTGGDARMTLQIALSYGGRWDMAEAAKSLAEKAAIGELDPASIDEESVAAELAFADLPDVDFFIRTGGELRLSNFILWQAAYAELYFSDVLWPDFNLEEYDKALTDFSRRQRRFGKTGEQVSGNDV